MSLGEWEHRSSRIKNRLWAIAVSALAGFSQGAVNLALPSRVETSPHPAVLLGIATTLMYLGMSFSASAAGRSIDHGRASRVGTLSLGLSAFVLFGYAWSTSIMALMAFRFLDGVALGTLYVVTESVLAKNASSANQGRWIAVGAGALCLGLIAGPIASSYYGFKATAFIAIVCALALCSVFVFQSFALLSQNQPVTGSIVDGATTLGFSKRIVGFFYGWSEGSIVAVFALLMGRETDLNLSTGMIALIASALVGALIGGFGVDRLGARTTTRLAFALQILGCCGAIFSLHALAKLAVAAFASGTLYTSSLSWTVEKLNPEQVGRASATFTRSYGIGSILSPLAAGMLVDYSGSMGLLILLAMGATLGVLSTFQKSKTRIISQALLHP